MGTNGEGNATLDGGRGLCFPSPSPNGSCNRLQDAGRAALVSHSVIEVVKVGLGAGVMGRGTPDPGNVTNGDGNSNIREDPGARACEKATGPIPPFAGPVPRVECNPSYDIPCGAFVDGGANLGKVAEDPLPICDLYESRFKATERVLGPFRHWKDVLGFADATVAEDPCQ